MGDHGESSLHMENFEMEAKHKKIVLKLIEECTKKSISGEPFC